MFSGFAAESPLKDRRTGRRTCSAQKGRTQPYSRPHHKQKIHIAAPPRIRHTAPVMTPLPLASMNPPGFFLILPVVFIFIGLGSLVHGLRRRRKARATRRWPTATAVVDDISLDTRFDGDSATTYAVAVKYHFDVRGKTIHGTRLAYDYFPSSDRDWQKALAEKLRGAETVKVRYSPFHPDDCVLMTNHSKASLFVCAGGLLFTAFGTFFLLMMLFDDIAFVPVLDTLVVDPPAQMEAAP